MHLSSSGDALADRRADYALRLSEAGDVGAAADLMSQALELAPFWTAGWVALGGYSEKSGAITAAIAAYEKALTLDPADGEGAGLKLASLGAAPMPQTMPPAFVRGLFDQYAERFETSLVDRLGYRMPEQLFSALQGVAGTEHRYLRALDLGCGTGLVGVQLRPVTAWLEGVDLSPAMLGKARRKAVYDRLTEADITALPPAATGFDLVTAADVLNYVGDLTTIVAAIAKMLVPGGLFALSLEAHDGDEPYLLLPSLRFAHALAPACRLAEAASLSLRHQSRVLLRRDRGVPLDGFLLIFERDVAIPSG
ncbi:methyltransferase [Aureimonas sp. SA4125]|uniref:class I SAM-dependent DNA methyltransferase n=1 Tax=Aureimonas sp. SA4125 TaxID=2826993 RepID=UPI001CC762D4|nr:methyltransferase domain-containing protein [Aureimonas sp. SA4125]BDA83202.1 methyltransferase [Aureimonas sp. SA4125]